MQTQQFRFDVEPPAATFLRSRCASLAAALNGQAVLAAMQQHDACHDQWIDLAAHCQAVGLRRTHQLVVDLYTFHGRVIETLQRAEAGVDHMGSCPDVRQVLLRRLEILTAGATQALTEDLAPRNGV